jgi:hypothetical protein
MTQTMEIVSYSSSILMLIKKQKIKFLDDEIPHMITLSSPHHTPSPLQQTRLPLMNEMIELGEMRLELFRLINNTQESIDAERTRKIAILMSFR